MIIFDWMSIGVILCLLQLQGRQLTAEQRDLLLIQLNASISSKRNERTAGGKKVSIFYNWFIKPECIATTEFFFWVVVMRSRFWICLDEEQVDRCPGCHGNETQGDHGGGRSRDSFFQWIRYFCLRNFNGFLLFSKVITESSGCVNTPPTMSKNFVFKVMSSSYYNEVKTDAGCNKWDVDMWIHKCDMTLDTPCTSAKSTQSNMWKTVNVLCTSQLLWHAERVVYLCATNI